MKFRLLLFGFLIVAGAGSLHAQDMLSALDTGNEKDFSIATFKGTRLINFHTTETTGPRTLDFRISHRFGAINSGFEEAFGIDQTANIRLGLEYSPDGRFMFGIGRSSFQKMVDGFLKFRLLRQTTNNSMPLSVTLFAGAYRAGIKSPVINGFELYEKETSRWSFNYQILIARKFSPSFSFQIAPWYNHYNMVTSISEQNDSYGASALFRLKFSKRSAITAEYAYRANTYSNTTYYDSFGVGYEIETGGHVFQVHLTNSFGLVENQFLPYTDTQWNDAGIRLGFNVSRVFTL